MGNWCRISDTCVTSSRYDIGCWLWRWEKNAEAFGQATVFGSCKKGHHPKAMGSVSHSADGSGDFSLLAPRHRNQSRPLRFAFSLPNLHFFFFLLIPLLSRTSQLLRSKRHTDQTDGGIHFFPDFGQFFGIFLGSLRGKRIWGGEDDDQQKEEASFSRTIC